MRSPLPPPPPRVQITSFSGSFSLFSLLPPHPSFNFRSKKALFISLFNIRLLGLPSPLFMSSTYGRLYLPYRLKARYGLSLRTDVSKTLYKRVCILPRQVTSSFCSTEMSEIVIVMDRMMTLSWQGRNGSLIKIQLHVLKYLLHVSKNWYILYKF